MLKMVGVYGMSEEIGRIQMLNRHGGGAFLDGNGTSADSAVSEQMLHAFALEVKGLEPTPEQRADVAAWVACLAGTLTREQYRAGLEAAGLTDVSLHDSHAVGDGFTSVIVSAIKPGAG